MDELNTDVNVEIDKIDEESVEVVEPQVDENIDTDNNNDDSDLDIESDETNETIESGQDTETKPKQSKEVDSAFAEIRRKAELAEKRANDLEAKLAMDAKIRNEFADYGVASEEDISKKYGESHGIHTYEDMQRAVLNEQYREQGIDPDMINKMIEEHPAIKEATKIKENTIISNQFNELVTNLKADGFENLVNEPADIPETVYKKWNYGKNGLTLEDCFYLDQRKNLISKKSEATRQRTLNNLNGKKHLKVQGDGSNSTNDNSVPNETMQYYLDAGFTKKEAMAHHKKLYGGK